MLAPIEVRQAGFLSFHGNTVLNRTYQGAKVAADAFVIDNGISSFAIFTLLMGDGLVGCIFAHNMAEATFNTLVVVNRRQGLVVEVELVPVGDVRDSETAKIFQSLVAFLIHPIVQSIGEVINDPETKPHGSGTHLHAATT